MLHAFYRCLDNKTASRMRLAWAAAAALVLVSVTPLIADLPAQADPSPQAGPTAGGTPVTGALPSLGFSEIAGSWYATYGLGTDGDIYAWGYNANGALGNNYNPEDSAVPIPVSKVNIPAGVTFTAVAGGGINQSSGYGLGSDGNIYAWGKGPLGTGTTADSPVPVRVDTTNLPAGVTFTGVAGCGGVSHALASDGSIYSWGYANAGTLGNNTSTGVALVPVRVDTSALPVGLTFTEVICNVNSASLALGSDGMIYTWGADYSSVFGGGPANFPKAPVPVDMSAFPGVTFTALAAAQGGTNYGLGSDGNIYAWGNSGFGALGNGATTGTSPLPVKVTAPAGVTFTAVSGLHAGALALGSDGNIYGWGANIANWLGIGTPFESPVPIKIDTWNLPSGVAITQVASGPLTAFALGTDGVWYAWGSNSNGGLMGIGSTSPTESAVLLPVQIPAPVIQSVTFDGVEGTNLAQTGATWTADTPPGCGPVDVVVNYLDLTGQAQSATYPNGFIYGSAPVITTEPSSGDVSNDGSFRASVEVAGDAAPSLQWQQQASDGTWTDLPGQTGATLTVAVLTKTASFRVVATNCWGAEYAATSEVITATVPDIDTGPVDVTPPAPVTVSHTGGTASAGPSPVMMAIALCLTMTGAAILTRRRRGD